MRKRMTAAVALVAALGVAATAVASGGPTARPLHPGSMTARTCFRRRRSPRRRPSRPRARPPSGALNEVDLDHAGGRLVFNVDVGNHDVKVDAANGRVVSVDLDD